MLVAAVEKYGGRKWTLVAKAVPGRNGKSCRLRWENQLKPGVDHSPFTKQEIDIIIAGHRKHGNHWSMIARELPSKRTDNAVKNFWNSHVKHLKRDRTGDSEDSGADRAQRMRVGPFDAMMAAGSPSMMPMFAPTGPFPMMMYGQPGLPHAMFPQLYGAAMADPRAQAAMYNIFNSDAARTAQQGSLSAMISNPQGTRF